ncbi:MAG: F-box protein, partial [Alphaproteobacteria bacterium]|nr:F-box protein [Alphaproteobacteria bacterium]
MMKPLIPLFLNLILLKSCLASYKEQGQVEAPPIYKRLRVERIETAKPLLILNQWTNLPHEVLVSCFDYLSFKELARVQLVCKYWTTIAKDKTLSVKYHFLKRSFMCLLRKIDQNPKVQEHVKEVISNSVNRGDIIKKFYTIPDFLHKSLLVPSAIARIVRTRALISSLFESNIKASCIYNALQQQTLDKEQRLAIESYSRLSIVRPWNKTIFSEDFLKYTHLYSPYYKAYYLLALFQLPTSLPIYTLLNMINRNLKNPQAYNAKNKEKVIGF